MKIAQEAPQLPVVKNKDVGTFFVYDIAGNSSKQYGAGWKLTIQQLDPATGALDPQRRVLLFTGNPYRDEQMAQMKAALERERSKGRMDANFGPCVLEEVPIPGSNPTWNIVDAPEPAKGKAN